MADRSPNPLHRSHPATHLPLVVLGVIFSLPFVWLLSTSLQPREQAMRVPPQWLPRLQVATVAYGDGTREIYVVPPEPVSAFAKLVGEAREAKTIPPADLAARVGLPAEELIDIETGTGAMPHQDVIDLLAAELELDAAQLHREAEDRLYVEYREVPAKGKRALVRRSQCVDGKVAFIRRIIEKTEELQLAVDVVQEVPAHWVATREWRVSKYTDEELHPFYLPPGEIRGVVEPVFGNYPEAVRALTSDPDDKQLPLGQLLAKSRMPWHGRDSDRPITFLTYLANTLTVTILGVIGTVLSSSLVAYGLARIPWKGRSTLFAITLATMMVPFPVLMVPLFSLFRQLGWIGKLYPLWVPAWFGSAFNIFLLRQFFLTMPAELSEAARIDGASELRIWWSIALPLARPALAVVALFHFLYAWNDFLGPLIYLQRPETFTLALGLQQYQSQSGGSEWHLLMAASVLMVVPIIVLFFFAQKTFIRGIATTGLKA